jgi:hypothetical protein
LTKTCPSIPHRQNRFGYAINNGQIKNIEKDSDTLEKERLSRKQYLSTLEGERNLTRDGNFLHYHGLDEKKRLYG